MALLLLSENTKDPPYLISQRAFFFLIFSLGMMDSKYNVLGKFLEILNDNK